MEWNRATKVGITRYCFFVDEDYPVAPSFVESGDGAEKLARLKKRIEENHPAAHNECGERGSMAFL